MFDIFSGQHILILLAVLLIVVGPKDLPRLMRIMGQWAGKARAMANAFKKSLDDIQVNDTLAEAAIPPALSSDTAAPATVRSPAP